MMQTKEKIQKKDINTIDDYYQYIFDHGKLLTLDHAHRWSNATLQMLGVNLSKGVNSRLRNALPEELADELGRIFWIAFFRNTNMALRDFQDRVAKRSRASSDPDFAYYPIKAVFGALQGLVDDQNVLNAVRDDLAPELSQAWENA